MAASTPVKKARAALAALFVILAGMGGLLAYGVQEDDAQWAPLLALDLEGGTQMVLSPVLEEEGEEVTNEDLEQAVETIRQRVDGTGVAEAEIAVQGAENIVVSLPGSPDQETRDLIQASADMELRSVLEIEQDVEYQDEVLFDELREELSEEEFEEAQEALEAQREAEGTEDETEGQAQPEDFPEPEAEPENHSDPNWITPELAAEFANYRCAQAQSLEDRYDADPDEPMIACNPTNGTKLLLSPVDVPGEMIDDADYGLSEGDWVATLQFDNEGTELFREASTRLYGFPQGEPRNQFAILLDREAISVASMNQPILDGSAQISGGTGGFTEEEVQMLSEQLRYGALPISFQIESEQQISATLGSEQLRMGLLAGVIGLLLTAGYAIYQYRALALAVTIPSLIVVAALTWWALSLLGWSDGYRLSMAGIAGLILSIGLTADSFVVYFERVKDELREGRSLAGAVEAGWARARRTILASKAVNIIAAVVLYLVAVGNVRGFAFTLGLTALIDVILVFLFTHPLMQLLARRRFFAAGKPFSGLSAKELGIDVLYKGAGRVARSNVVYSRQAAAAVGAGTDEAEKPEPGQRAPASPLPPSDPEAEAARRQEVPDIADEEWAQMTIAERKRARAKAQAAQTEQQEESMLDPTLLTDADRERGYR